MTRYQTFPDLKIGNQHIRLRRLRKNENIRSLVQENYLLKSDLIYPIFISEKGTSRYDIPSLPGISRIPFNKRNRTNL
jgi:porphobilinogen synthase